MNKAPRTSSCPVRYLFSPVWTCSSSRNQTGQHRLESAVIAVHANDEGGGLSTSEVSSKYALPGYQYSSEEHFNQEVSRIHKRSWWIVGHVSEWKARGDYQRYKIFGENIIVVRDRNGNLNAMANICQHRGAEICSEDRGSTGMAIRCPYHGWAYRQDGTILAVPSRDAFDEDPTNRRLPQIRTEIALGFVWVNLDPECDPLSRHLELIFNLRFGPDENPMDKYQVGELGLAKRVDYGIVRANWKLLWENFSECYHCPALHNSLCAAVPQFSAGYGTVTGPKGQGAEIAEKYTGFSASGQLTGSVLPGVDERMFYGALLWPTGQIVCVSDHVTLLCMIPVSADETRVVGYWLFQQEDIDAEDFDPSGAVELFDVTNKEDFDACERMQRNTTTSYWNSSQIYSPFEYRIDSFRNWVSTAMEAQNITEAYASAIEQPEGWESLPHMMGKKFSPELTH